MNLNTNNTPVSEFVTKHAQYTFRTTYKEMPLAVFPGHIDVPPEYEGAMAQHYGDYRSGGEGCSTVIYRDMIKVPIYDAQISVTFRWDGRGYTMTAGYNPKSRFDIAERFTVMGVESPRHASAHLVEEIISLISQIQRSKPWAWQTGASGDVTTLNYIVKEANGKPCLYHNSYGNEWNSCREWLPMPHPNDTEFCKKGKHGFFANWRDADILPDAPCWCVVSTYSGYEVGSYGGETMTRLVTPTKVAWFDGKRFDTDVEVLKWLALPDQNVTSFK